MPTHKTGAYWYTLILWTVCILTASLHAAAAADPEPAGWYAGDIHVHRSCGGPPVSVQSIYNSMRNQNLAVVSLLADSGNGEVQNSITDLPLVTGSNDPISSANHIIRWDTEWHWDATYFNYAHQALGGHIVALGLSEAHQIWAEYTGLIFQWARQQNAIAGFAHFQYLPAGIPQDLNCCIPIEYPVEIALGACDFISEDVSGGDAAIAAYYRLLNCGFRPGFAGGSDYPCAADIGSVVTFSQTQGPLTYSAWINGIAKGRTVVSRNGRHEFLNLIVNNSATPGDEIKLNAAGAVAVSAQWSADQNLNGTIEILYNGVVTARLTTNVSNGATSTLSATVDCPRSGWIVARRISNRGHEVHTAAVFVIVNNAPVRASVDDAQFYVAWIDSLLEKTAVGGVWSSYFPTQRSAAHARYQAARAVYQQIATESAALQPLTVSTNSLPSGVINLNYTALLTAAGGTAPYRWLISAGTLPTGLPLDTGKGTISGIPTVSGVYQFTAAVSDSSSPAKAASAALSITITTLPTTVNIWSAAAKPDLIDGGPDSSVELGVKFRSDLAGKITGIRFYKATGNTGTHTGTLWSLNGTALATATFSGESSTGWQQCKFTTPVSISANTVYIASYHAPNGHYSADTGYFSATGFDNAPLHALADGASGGNGVYAYGAKTVFPNKTWNTANYWVDIVFEPATGPTLAGISVTPTNPTIDIGLTQQFTAIGSYSDGSTQTITNAVNWTSSQTNIASITAGGLATALNAGTTTLTATLNGVSAATTLNVRAGLAITNGTLPNATLNTAYSVTLTGSGGVAPYNWSLANGALPSGLTLDPNTGIIRGTPTTAASYSFTVNLSDSSSPKQSTSKAFQIIVSTTPLPISIWTGNTAPTLVDGGADSPVELGVKFRSDVAGTITAIRFYKAATNTGPHVGNLWSATGTLLATVTFGAETSSGWQQANFNTPVTINANTVYVASYHVTTGHYSADVDYFATKGVDNPPLHALANGVSGGNSVYAYGSNSLFPTLTWRTANYWVDIVFVPSP